MEYKLKFENGRSCEIYCESDGKPLQDKINAAEERFGSKVKTINGKEVTEHGLGGFLIGAIIGGLAGNAVSKQGVKKTIKSVGTEAKKVAKKTTAIAKKAVDAVKKKEAPKSKKSNYVPNRLIDSIETKSGKKIDNKDIIDGAHTKKKILVSKKRVASTPKDIDKEKALKLQSDYLSSREIKVVNTVYGRKIKGSEIIDGAYVKKGVFEDGGKLENFNFKKFTLSELIALLPEDVEFLWMHKENDDNYDNFIRKSQSTFKSVEKINWTISSAPEISFKKGSENLYLDFIVYDEDSSAAETPYIISLYSKDNHAGLKMFAAALIQKFKSGGYTTPSYDTPITGKYEFVSKDGKKYDLKVYRYERQNDTDDSLEIQDELRDELGSIIFKNSAWKNLSKGKTIMAKSSKGLEGKLTRVANLFEDGGKTDYSYEYMLLDRLRQDNEYYLGFGNRNPSRLWAGNVDEQISEMKRLYNSLPEKPQWITMEDIEEYERKMKTEEMAKGGVIGDSGTITDTKSMYQGKMGFIEMDMGNEWIVKILDGGKEKSVTVRKSGFKILEDEEFGDGGKTSKEYKIFEGFDHLKKKNVYRVIGVENDYVGEWHNIREEAESELHSMSKKYASGGIVGKDVTFNHWSGDIRKGIITEQLADGQYAVSSGFGSVLVSPDDIISTSDPAPQKKFLGIFEDGGKIGNSDLLSDAENFTLNELLKHPIFENYKEIKTFTSGGNLFHTMILLENGHVVTINWEFGDIQYSSTFYPSIDEYAYSSDPEEESGWDNEFFTDDSESRMMNMNESDVNEFLTQMMK